MPCKLLAAAIVLAILIEPAVASKHDNKNCNRACNQLLDKCEKNPPHGNDRICASDYYACMKKAKCKYDPNS